MEKIFTLREKVKVHGKVLNCFWSNNILGGGESWKKTLCANKKCATK
jgi:hypothetical protein